jgi:hypothetical protein
VVVIVPAVSGGTLMPLPPIETQSDTGTESKEGTKSDGLKLRPAEITAAKIPIFPNGSVIGGSVVLQALIGRNGQQGLVRIVKDVGPLTPSALQVLKDCKFTPARLNGERVRSNVVLLFDYGWDMYI